VSFAWRTSFVGFPNFFSGNTAAHELADFFRLFADGVHRQISYQQLKAEARQRFGISPHQTETKKAAFQEFGICYVMPGSDVISLTPAGDQLFSLARDPTVADAERRRILLLLSRCLSRFQFSNPFPAGVNKRWADSTDVLPYLSTYYALMKLRGLITVSELFGALFGLRRMRDLPSVVERIAKRRKTGRPFERIEGLPRNLRTAANPKIYFMAHLSLDSEILRDERVNLYGSSEQCYELTEAGAELVDTILNDQWLGWQRSQSPPSASSYTDIADYFNNGVGQKCPWIIFKRDSKRIKLAARKIAEGILPPEDVETLRNLPKRSFEEGQRKLITHSRIERNQSVVREAKRRFKRLNGRLYCEICGFDFSQRYSDRGSDFIEAHHKEPISGLGRAVKVTVDDLEMVCANCHRMLHRQPWISAQELRQLV